MRHFKQTTAYQFRRKTSETLWEFSYYDHILRKNDSMIEVARYTWWNPVQEGVSAVPADYPYSGSQTLPWIQDSQSASKWHLPEIPSQM